MTEFSGGDYLAAKHLEGLGYHFFRKQLSLECTEYFILYHLSHTTSVRDVNIHIPQMRKLRRTRRSSRHEELGLAPPGSPGSCPYDWAVIYVLRGVLDGTSMS